MSHHLLFKNIGRDTSDNERDDTPAIHGVSQTWHFQPNFTGIGPYIFQAIILSGLILAVLWLHI